MAKQKNAESVKTAKNKKARIADSADKHHYYERAVQAVEPEIDFVDETFKQIRGYHATSFREDFCGTGNTSCEWVRRRDTNQATGLDLDTEVLQWGRDNKVSELNEEQQNRIVLKEKNVLHCEDEKAQIVIAMNFSYMLFKTRAQLLEYFTLVYRSLNDDGVFIIDSYGGHESYKEIKEKTKFKDFTYYWHQKSFNPINGDMQCYIHFKFKDGSKLKKAFSYNWRMWTLPELQEIMTEAGFKNVTVYWEGVDEDTGEGDGIFTPQTQGTDDPSWIAYVSGEK